MIVRKQDLAPWLWGVAITALLLLPLPTGAAARRWPALINELTDFGHPLAFAWFAHVWFVSLRSRLSGRPMAPFLWVIAGVAAYGAATELVQQLVDRQPSLADFRNDMLGAMFALLLHARGIALQPIRRLALLGVAAGVAVVAAQPLAWTLAAYAHRSVRAPLIWQPDSRLFARFASEERVPGATLRLREPPPDWRPYAYLEIDIENPLSAPYPVVVRIHDLRHDQRHADRFNRRFELAAGSRQVLRIDLAEVRDAPANRQMDMRAIRGIVVFSVAPTPSASFRVHSVRLAR